MRADLQAGADVPLSITLSAATNTLAIGSMPLLLLFWTRALGVTEVVIPYTSIVVSLLMVLFPAGLGVWLRTKKEKWAKRGEKVGAFVGACVVIGSVVTGLIANANVLADKTVLPWTTYAAVTIVAPVGMLFSGIFISVLMNRCGPSSPKPRLVLVCAARTLNDIGQ